MVIDYYDDLISEIDIYAEECLKKIPEDEYLKICNLNDDCNDSGDSSLFYRPIEKQFEDPYGDEYKFDESEHIIYDEKVLRSRILYIHKEWKP